MEHGASLSLKPSALGFIREKGHKFENYTYIHELHLDSPSRLVEKIIEEWHHRIYIPRKLMIPKI